VTTTSATSLSFTATMSFAPASVLWYTDGTVRGNATGSLTTWNITWDLGTVTPGASSPNAGEVLDGTYLISAKGFDAYGQSGSAKYSTVTINRRAPYPPTNVRAGRNGSKGYIEWGANAERDVEGYRVFRVGSPDLDVCGGLVTGRTRCVDTGIPAPAQQYYVQAVDRDSVGNARLGDKSAIANVPASTADQPPYAPPTIVAAKSGTNTVLSWTAASPEDPDAGDSVQYYRIYRDGTDFIANLYDRTATGAQRSYTDNNTGGDVHTYYVVAVDQSNVESATGSGVTK